MQIQSIEIEAIVEAAIPPFLSRAQQHGVILKINPIPDIMVKVDCFQIELVLRNLLDNAFDAVLSQPNGNRAIVLSSGIVDGETLEITITDSGPGVSGDMVGKLFEPFVSSKSSGMGLGLVLSRTIIEAHGGNLWAEIGDHGVFKFALPLEEAKK